jgi:hypothetical protein
MGSHCAAVHGHRCDCSSEKGHVRRGDIGHRLTRLSAPCDVCLCASAQLGARIVSELCHISPESHGKHRHLWGHVNAHRCWVKSLIPSVLVGPGVRQHGQAESISKRAPSTTRTSLRFRINHLRILDRAKSNLYLGLCPNPLGVSMHFNRLRAITGFFRHAAAWSPLEA